MAGGSWKVAYADFMTAMFAFFLLMWILNATPKEDTPPAPPGGEGAEAGKPGEVMMPEALGTSVNMPNIVGGSSVQYVDKIDTREYNPQQIRDSYYSIIQTMKGDLSSESLPQAAAGIRYNSDGVMINLTSDLMFEPGTTSFSADGEKILDTVMDVMRKYDVYLVVRGYTDTSETGRPKYPSKWELSAARANSAIEALIARGANPARMRGVAYADTNPLVPSTVSNAAQVNSRVEFRFHRPEVMSTISTF